MHPVLDTSSSLSQPSSSLSLDTTALLDYLRRQAPQILRPGVTNASQLTVQQFAHGQSNPTYLISGPALQHAIVLRKKPPGKILPSAHSVEREYQVLAALSKGSQVPVPRPVLMCNESEVLGTPFYIMEFAKGHIFIDPNLPDKDPSTRSSIYSQMANALAALHATDVSAVGLTSYGTPANYCRRQLRRWTTQYQASVSATPSDVTKLMDWLHNHIPAVDVNPDKSCIAHGDYRLDNLVFQPQPDGSLKLIAALDWELSTLGNRWSDVAYSCLPYHLPPDMQILKRLGGAEGKLPAGIPTEQEYLAMYCGAAGVPPPSAADWAFYVALSLFRLLAILAGVQARSKQGNASSARAAAVSSNSVLASIAQAALSVIGQQEASGGSQSHAVTTQPLQTGNVPTDISAPLPDHVARLLESLQQFMAQYIYPAEDVFEEHAAGPDRWTIHPKMEELKQKAKEAGLWNLWLPGSLAAKLQHLVPMASNTLNAKVLLGAGLSHWEYAHLCEIMGRSIWAPEVFNCGAPDTGNMEVLAKYGSPAQQALWLLPLLQGDIRSCFAMTEKAVASSDATNIQSTIRRDGDHYEVSGVKWWTSGACDPRCAISIFMGKTDTSAPIHKQQSMVLVPFDAVGVRVVRPMMVFGYDDAPHGHAEVVFDKVRVPAHNLILGEGRGFEIAQGRLGPGRLHHCMRLIGLAERAMELMSKRAMSRTVFGKPIAAQGAFRSDLAKCRVDLEGARLLVLHAAAALDRSGNKVARGALAAAKYAAPNMALRVVDTAIQAHGAAGVSQDTVLSRLWAVARTLRIADGPDEVHLGTIAKLELAKASKL